MIHKLAILGVGLIGGSLARALRAAGQVREVTGFGRSRGSLDLALELGVIDSAAADARDAVRGADMVVLAVPVGSMHELFASIATALPAQVVVTDVGSVKASVVADAQRLLGTSFARFVPGHPIAGSEQAGVGAATEDLFRGRRVVVTPVSQTAPDATARVEAMWKTAGAEVVTMPVAEHDQLLAATSHLPHVLAYALVDMLARRPERCELFDCTAGGFRDFTRIAGSDPVMWRDICLANREPLLGELRQYREQLGEIIRLIEAGDGERLREIFAHAKHARDGLNQKP
jgi:prephenate dehydrogenase